MGERGGGAVLQDEAGVGVVLVWIRVIEGIGDERPGLRRGFRDPARHALKAAPTRRWR